ncbi:MAG TPA: hypothetical protein VFJ02_13565 [Vicinamibacterales bacterium]|nr:hypothetical protein [Vicinamibacterales bacterium]
MSKSDRDSLLERLARLNALLDDVESACADSAELRTTILKARAELQATARSLRLATVQDFTGEKD